MPDHGLRPQTRTNAIDLGGRLMHTTVGRSAHADQLDAEVRDARCCTDRRRCAECQAKLDEVRAARRDALIHRIASTRPRRALH